MGNIFHHGRRTNLGESEIHYNHFTENYESTQYPKNLNTPFDEELYSITHRESQRCYTLRRITFHSHEALQSFLMTLEHALTLDHPNILKIERYFVQENTIKEVVVSYSVNIIMEQFEHTLRDELLARQRTYDPFSESQLRELMSQIAGALDFLQSKNLYHGSLCPPNIFLTKDDEYKLCFLGEPMYTTDDKRINPRVMTFLDYMSPSLRSSLTASLVMGDFSSKPQHNQSKSDIFSLGLIMLEVASLKDIQNLNITGSEAQRVSRVQGCQRRLKGELVKLMGNMIHETESKRPTFIDIKKISEIRKDETATLSVQSTSERASLPTIRLVEPKKMSCLIEMKTIGDYSGDKVCFNYPFDTSVLSDYPSDDEGMHKSFSNKNGDDDDSPAGNQRVTRKYQQCKSVGPGSLSDRHHHFRSYSNDKRADFQIRHESPTRIETDTSELCDEEFLINNETDLYKPISLKIRRLGIKLGGQPYKENIAQVLADFIIQQEHLKELLISLPNMSIGDQGISTIITSIKPLSHLDMLFLEIRKNRMTNTSIHALGRILRGKKGLVQLGIDLAGNFLSKEMCCEELETAFSEFDGLKSLALNLGGNQMKNEGIVEVSKLISKLKDLETLVIYMYSNEVDCVDSVSAFFKNIHMLTKLKTLSIDMSDNMLRDDAGSVILSFLKESPVKQISIELLNNCMSETMKQKMEEDLNENFKVNAKTEICEF